MDIKKNLKVPHFCLVLMRLAAVFSLDSEHRLEMS